MAQDKTIQVCALNIDAHPHPAGAYLAALTKASGFLVSARGQDSAKITKPIAFDKNGEVYFGRILVWTNIDLRGAG